MIKVAVIGGGASGLTAAIAASNAGAEAVIYEGGARCGRKILATGNGRCNLTNINASVKNYHGANPQFIMGVMQRFWVNETIEFFESLGVLCKTEDNGKVYPYSDQASAILDVLRMKCERNGVKSVTGFAVADIKKCSQGFKIMSYDGRTEWADKVIVAAGGKAAPDLGTKGGGYSILKSFGHRISDLKPTLVQMKTTGDIPKKLKGIKFIGTAHMGEFEESGEILFTEYGFSGPPIFSLSSRYNNHKCIKLDLMPGYSEDRLSELLYNRIALNPDITLDMFFVGMLNKRIGQVLLKDIGIAPLSRKAVSLEYPEIEQCVKSIKGWKFDIAGTLSWNNAQATKGGALTSEFDANTLESLKQKGLYAAGEVLDIDGDCGGYNLQWAWASGTVAGKSAAMS